MDAEVSSVLEAIESDMEQGAVGVALEPAVSSASDVYALSGDTGAEAIPGAVVSAAAMLTAVTVAVGGHEQADRALRAGATGIMVRRPIDARLRAIAANSGGELWLTGITDPPSGGPVGERLILESPVGSVSGLADILNSNRTLVASARIACSLPRAASLDDGVLEALVTLAVFGGASVLRCGGAVGHAGNSDVRVVRRCADVAMELVRSGVAQGEAMSGGQGVAS